MNVLAMLLLLSTLVVAPAEASSDTSLAEAKRVEAMIERGEVDRAEARLDGKPFPPLIEATLRGRLALARGRPLQAERAFERATRLAPDHAPLRILLAHAQIAAGHHRDALSTLRGAGLDARDPTVAILRSAAHSAAGEHRQAYDVLRSAAEAHPDDRNVRRRLVAVSAQAGLFVVALQWAETMTPEQLGPQTALAVMQRARGTPGTLSIARRLAAGFRNDAEVQAQLGWIESAAGEFSAAARSLSTAARLGADTAYAAAEHYRAARRYRDALATNARVGDRARRVTQRFDILFESGRMARAIAAAETLEASGGLTPRRRYNLAYAHYSLRQFAEASRLARALDETPEAGRARALLRAMGR